MEEWVQRRGIDKGAVLSLEQCWGFTQDWYKDRGDLDWQPKTVEETQAIFERNGLVADFWQVV